MIRRILKRPADVPLLGAPPYRREVLSGWGGTPKSAADVFAIRKAADVRRAFDHHLERELPAERGSFIARGLGRSYGDSAQNAGGAVLAMAGLDGVLNIDLEAGTIQAESGMSLDSIIRLVLPLGFFVPVTPGTRFVTVGGALASDIHGKNHHQDGSIQQHVTEFTMDSPHGVPVRVTREEHPELFAATMGGMGLTGVITSATLRLIPVETAYMRVDTERAANLDDVMERMLTGDGRYRYSVAWTDSLARGKSLGRSVLLRANHATRDELDDSQDRRPLAFSEGFGAGVPAWVPGGLLRRSTMKAFNETYFRRAPREERGRIESMTGYFHPLDRLRNWNRIYGPRGLVQYQFVVPDGKEAALRRTFEMLSAAGCPSFLTVLKRFGPGAGMLSFPAAGWTLALDIPAGTKELDGLLDRLDRVVASVGGRVYLAKDSRLSPAMLAEMYPELERWKAVRAAMDPEGTLRSDLARRLNLV